MQFSHRILMTGATLGTAAALAAPAAAQSIDVTVNIPRLKVAEYHRPYVAIWIEPAAGKETYAPFAKIHAGLAHIGSGARDFVQHDVAALAVDILLNDDRVRAGWHRCAREDARGLAGADGLPEPVTSS